MANTLTLGNKYILGSYLYIYNFRCKFIVCIHMYDYTAVHFHVTTCTSYCTTVQQYTGVKTAVWQCLLSYDMIPTSTVLRGTAVVFLERFSGRPAPAGTFSSLSLPHTAVMIHCCCIYSSMWYIYTIGSSTPTPTDPIAPPYPMCLYRYV